MEAGDDNELDSGKPGRTARPTTRLFRCTGFPGCDMVFNRSEHLARHVRKHTGERPFQCHCGRQFSRLDNLRQHAATMHSDEKDRNDAMFAQLAAVHNELAMATAQSQRDQGMVIEHSERPSRRGSRKRKHSSASAAEPALAQTPLAGASSSASSFQLLTSGELSGAPAEGGQGSRQQDAAGASLPFDGLPARRAMSETIAASPLDNVNAYLSRTTDRAVNFLGYDTNYSNIAPADSLRQTRLPLLSPTGTDHKPTNPSATMYGSRRSSSTSLSPAEDEEHLLPRPPVLPTVPVASTSARRYDERIDSFAGLPSSQGFYTRPDPIQPTYPPPGWPLLPVAYQQDLGRIHDSERLDYRHPQQAFDPGRPFLGPGTSFPYRGPLVRPAPAAAPYYRPMNVVATTATADHQHHHHHHQRELDDPRDHLVPDGLDANQDQHEQQHHQYPSASVTRRHDHRGPYHQ